MKDNNYHFFVCTFHRWILNCTGEEICWICRNFTAAVQFFGVHQRANGRCLTDQSECALLLLRKTWWLHTACVLFLSSSTHLSKNIPFMFFTYDDWEYTDLLNYYILNKYMEHIEINLHHKCNQQDLPEKATLHITNQRRISYYKWHVSTTAQERLLSLVSTYWQVMEWPVERPIIHSKTS